MYQAYKFLLGIFGILVLFGCGGETAGWSEKNLTQIQKDEAEALYELAGRPRTPIILIWSRDGTPLSDFSSHMAYFEEVSDSKVLTVDVEPWGVETDMLSVPVEAVRTDLGSGMMISLAGPLSGEVPSGVEYVCILPPLGLYSRNFPGLRAALLPGSGGIEGLESPSNGSEEFRDMYRVIRSTTP